ncbi:hypothetical protein EV175_003226 [Coemansia sp. RSA 1933]|nr:hypothetical protein EV175_003226 [Coemansia sp. RSA 1933]
MSYLVQIQRLSEPHQQQKQQQKSAYRQKQHCRQPSSVAESREPQPGLGYVYAACSLCAKKAVRTQTQQWACHACKRNVDSVRWTYRLGVHLNPPLGTDNALSSSVLGAVADAWFGCTASQWVHTVERDVSLVARIASAMEPSGCGRESGVAAKMGNDVAALVEGMSGICGSYALFDFRPPGPRMQQGGVKVLQGPTISRIAVCEHRSEETWLFQVSELWKYVLLQTLRAMHRHCCDSSELYGMPIVVEIEDSLRELRTDKQMLTIANALRTPPSMTMLSCISDPPETDRLVSVTDTRGLIGLLSSTPCRAWGDMQLSITHCSQPAVEAEETDDMDALLDQYSQLLQSFTSTNAAAAATGRQDNAEDAMSTQLFEESMQDDQRHSLFADYSQQLMQSQGLLSVSTGDLFGQDEETWSQSQYSTPPATFLRALEATPETVARDIRNQAEILSDHGSSQIEVLAPETPAAASSSFSSSEAAAKPADSWAFGPMKRRKMDSPMSPSWLLRGLNDVMTASGYRSDDAVADSQTKTTPPQINGKDI